MRAEKFSSQTTFQNLAKQPTLEPHLDQNDKFSVPRRLSSVIFSNSVFLINYISPGIFICICFLERDFVWLPALA